MPEQKILLIIPCYNESQRLAFDQIQKTLPTYVDLLFADDGSTDTTADLIAKFCLKNPRHRLYKAPQNQGKAGVLRGAYLSLSAKPGALTNYTWIGFWDADLATPLGEIEKFLSYQKLFYPKAKALFGSRIARAGATIRRSPVRHYLGRVFVTFADFLLGIRLYDSQCGAKLFKTEVTPQVFKEVFLSRWIFDLEIVLRLGENDIVEVPLQQWIHIPGSKIKLGREAFRVLKDLFRIRHQYKR